MTKAQVGESFTVASCWRCRGAIRLMHGKWVHKDTLLPYSSLGGDHLASPFDPDAAHPADERDLPDV